MAHTIQEQLADPFGPYIIQEVLQPTKVTKRFKNKDYVLNSLVLRQGSKFIGLNRIDNSILRDRGKVRFRGVLCISDVRWLTEDGRKWLQEDINARIGGSHLTLGYCINNQKLKILIQGDLFSEPTCLTCNCLKLHSYDRKTKATFEFTVKSMEVYTYERSRNYLFRNHLLNTLATIVDENKSLPKEASTPLAGRTPKWLVDRYMELVNRRNREDMGNPAHGHRRVHRAEVYSIFAKYAPWMSALVEKKGLLNKETWIEFCDEVQARRNQESTDGNLDNWNEFEKLWEWQSQSQIRPEGETLEVRYIPYELPGDSYTYIVDDRRSPSLPIQGKRETRSPKLIDQTAFAAVPGPFYTERPTFPKGFVWRCPAKHCTHFIDFLKLSDDDLSCVSESDKHYLRSLDWKVHDEKGRFMELFYDIVEFHYYYHLQSIDIKVIAIGSERNDIFDQPVFEDRIVTEPRQLRSNDEISFVWGKPRNHKPAFYKLHE